LSGVATGTSWLFFYHALKHGNASHVVPIDKLSIVLTMGFARLFLEERFSKRSIIGLGLLTIGTLTLLLAL
jgi:transporter family protein